MAIVNTHYGYCGGSKAPKFTYTGTYNVREDGVVELLTSGTLVFINPAVIDVFLVGGGGAGGYIGNNVKDAGCGGGGGGYTRTIRKIPVTANQSIPVTIGAGGALRQNGGATSFGTEYTVNGGVSPYVNADGRVIGGAGGSGGGGGVTYSNDYGSGGSDGANGETGYPSTVIGGRGQGSTTREFGEESGKLYAGGGGGGRITIDHIPVISKGGDGGGGAGAWVSSGKYQVASAGVPNTGGGGGGRATYSSYSSPLTAEAGPGGSGIVCLRVAR